MAEHNDSADRVEDTLAARLNELFATVTYQVKGRRREFSTPYVAKAISEDAEHDTTISRVYLAGLRNGTNTNPSRAVMVAIAKFFDDHRAPDQPPVTVGYLAGDVDAPEERELRAALADGQVRAIAMRAGNMSPRVRQQMLDMLDILDPQAGEPQARDSQSRDSEARDAQSDEPQPGK